MVELKTKELQLRTVCHHDVHEVFQFILRNREHLRVWEPVRDENYFTVEYQINQINIELDKINRGEMYKFWIFKEERIIGSISLNNVVRGAFLSCHLGYRIDEQEQGKGYATEAIRAVVDYAFTKGGLHRIEANIMPRNLGSLRVVEKLGFINEGIAKKYLKINGKWEDHIHMVLLNFSIE